MRETVLVYRRTDDAQALVETLQADGLLALLP